MQRLARHWKRVSDYTDERAASVKPSAEWRTFIETVNSFEAAVDECFKRIQGRDKIMAEQNRHLATLCGEVHTVVGIIELLSSINMSTIVEKWRWGI